MHICVVHLITVVHVHVTVGKVIVVDVGDIRNIDVRVGDIDAVKVSAAYPIPRDEWFTKTKRAPSQASAETESDPTSPAAAKAEADIGLGAMAFRHRLLLAGADIGDGQEHIGCLG